MKNSHLLQIIFICLMISGCATQAGYYPAKNSQEGYSETKVQEGIYNIHYQGNEDTTLQRVTDFALLRSAETALENGFRYFTVLNQKADARTTTDSIPSTVPAGCFGWPCFPAYYTFWSTYTYQIPSILLMIQCSKEKPENLSTIIFDAEQVKSNIRKQYGLLAGPPTVQIANSPKEKV